MRAGSLQELVYKQGQAGVSKASVSIVFNNSDKPNSPVGYEQYDQITVTRQVRLRAACESRAAGTALADSASSNFYIIIELTFHVARAAGHWRPQQVPDQWPCRPAEARTL